MNFNSLVFLLFFIVVFTLFYLLPKKWRVGLLLVASYIFYLSWNFYLISVILGVTIVTYLFGRFISKTEDIKKKKIYLSLSVIICVGLLIIFKYLDFLIGGINGLIGLFNSSFSLRYLNIILPVGISFYTFQSLSYVIDVYRGEKSESNFFNYALYISFFPQLVAGPIERSKDLLPQLTHQEDFKTQNLIDGLPFIISGFFKKVVIADYVAVFVNTAYGDINNASGIGLFVATILFSIQIYCDFSGYSEIAIGCAKLIGINLTKNFNEPYLAIGFNDFWKRWHITLTRWFRDYIYIPLGGNRKGKVRKCINILIIFTISGLWHGARITFLLWGIVNGLLLIIENAFKPLVVPKLENNTKAKNILKPVYWLFTYLVIVLTWVLFRSQNINEALIVYSKIFTSFDINYLVNTMNFTYSSLIVVIVLLIGLYLLPQLPKYENKGNFNNEMKVSFIYMLLIMIVAVSWIYLYSKGEGSEFIYFQF